MVDANQNTHVRWMIRKELPAVLAIDKESNRRPWTEDQMIRILRVRKCICMVAERADKKILGFMVYELGKGRIHIKKMAVAADHRRSRVGSAMVQKLANKLSHDGRSRLVAEVEESNLGAQLFLREHGFRATAVLHDFYENSAEAAYLMYYRLDEPATELLLEPKNRIAQFMK